MTSPEPSALAADAHDAGTTTGASAAATTGVQAPSTRGRRHLTLTEHILGRVPSLVVVVIGATFTLAALSLDLGSLQSPGPGMWPTVVGVTVILLGAVSALSPDFEIEALDTSRKEYLLAGLAFAEVLVAVAAFWFLGYFAAAFVAVALMARTFSKASWRQLLVVAVIFGAVVQFFFGSVLALPTPMPLPWS